ncbi:MAG: aldo/keto reductase [Planctomycetota bacterium]|nr:MAG: aldo/keto reductase [Planctomycetota bacterium]
MLPRSQLGKTGLRVTRLGYGSMGLRGPRTWGVRVVDETHAERMLHAVLDAGINFIDTAPDYGIAEERIGRYLSHRRSEFFLATKCGCTPVQHDDHLEIVHTWSPEVIAANVEQSLRRMRTEYIDVLQFHGGTLAELQSSGSYEAARRLQDRGLVRWIGISSKLPEILDHLRPDLYDTLQLPYSVLDPSHADAMACGAALGMGIIVRGGIAHGGPEAEIQREHLNRVWERLQLDELRPPDMSRAQFILRYTLSQPACHTAIVGTCNLQHLQENVRAAEAGPLPQELVDEIQRRWTALRDAC